MLCCLIQSPPLLPHSGLYSGPEVGSGAAAPDGWSVLVRKVYHGICRKLVPVMPMENEAKLQPDHFIVVIFECVWAVVIANVLSHLLTPRAYCDLFMSQHDVFMTFHNHSAATPFGLRVLLLAASPKNRMFVVKQTNLILNMCTVNNIIYDPAGDILWKSRFKCGR